MTQRTIVVWTLSLDIYLARTLLHIWKTDTTTNWQGRKRLCAGSDELPPRSHGQYPIASRRGEEGKALKKFSLYEWRDCDVISPLVGEIFARGMDWQQLKRACRPGGRYIEVRSAAVYANFRDEVLFQF